VQSAFCEDDGLMCGFCTPGFVMAITAELEVNPTADLDRLKDACAGNLCRCGTYPQIFDAAVRAAKTGLDAINKGAK
jgi:xanthine dehydrogenase YagT iron-sulfur-binding subunit